MAALQSSRAGKTKANTTTGKTRNRSPLKLYFLLITLTGVVGSLITLGILIFSVAKNVIITDQEYIISERYYELDMCNNPVLKSARDSYAVAVPTQENYVQPTDAEIEKCKADKTEQLIQGRKASFKMDVLGGAIRAILFLALLLTHYPRFMASRKDD